MTVSLSIPLGIIVGLVASGVQSLGLTIQRKSHVLNQKLPPEQQVVEHRRPLWLIGIAIFLSSNILGSLVQIASLPVVILAPLGAVSLLFNALFACFLLGDIFSPMLILGTIFIASGAVLIALFGIVQEPTRSLEDLLRLFSRTTFVVYFSILGTVVALCLITTHVVDYSLHKRVIEHLPPPTPSSPHSPLANPAHPATLTTGVTDNLTGAVTTERTPLLDAKSNTPLKYQSSSNGSLPSRAPSPLPPHILKRMNRTRLFIALSYASISGLLSGMCLIFAKSGVELLLVTVNGDNQFWRWEAWALLLGLVVFALAQLWYLHKALVLADPTIVCPSAFCFYNLSSIVNGLVYFDQFSLITPWHLVLVATGIIVLLAGVWIVSVHSESADAEEEDETLSLDEDVRSPMSTTFASSPVSSEDEEEEADEGTSMLRHSRLSQSESMISPHSRHASHHTTLPQDSSPHHQRNTSLIHRRLTQSASHPLGTLLLSPPPPISLGGGSREGSGPLSPPIGGFQIGLSPISPGFAIRGRKMSTTSSQGGARTKRRTMSESLRHGEDLLRSSVTESTDNVEPATQPRSGPRFGIGLGRWAPGRRLNVGEMNRTVSEDTGSRFVAQQEIDPASTNTARRPHQRRWRWPQRKDKNDDAAAASGSGTPPG